jgi:hypothetical protein
MSLESPLEPAYNMVTISWNYEIDHYVARRNIFFKPLIRKFDVFWGLRFIAIRL